MDIYSFVYMFCIQNCQVQSNHFLFHIGQFYPPNRKNSQIKLFTLNLPYFQYTHEQNTNQVNLSSCLRLSVAKMVSYRSEQNFGPHPPSNYVTGHSRRVNLPIFSEFDRS